MATIKAKTTGQRLELNEIETISSGDVNVDKLEVTLDDIWDDYAIRVVFYTSRDLTRYEMSLDNEGKCCIPYQVMTKPCKMKIGLIGTNGDRTLTSTIAEFDVFEGTQSGVSPSAVNPDAYEKLIWKSYTLDAGDEDITMNVGSLVNKYNYYLKTTGKANLTQIADGDTSKVQDYTIGVTCKQLNYTVASSQRFGVAEVSASSNTRTWGDNSTLKRYNISCIWDGDKYLIFICSYDA